MSYPVVCLSCAQRGAVNKLTAGLTCRCGGQVDLYLDTPEQRQFVASRRSNATFASWMGLHASSKPDGPEGMESSPGSNEYAGKPPGLNEMSNHEGEITCPVCHGSGSDILDVGESCRECNGSGKVTPTTTPRDPEVYRHRYPPDGERNKQTKVPFVGRRAEFRGRESARSDLFRRVVQTNPGLSRREAARLVDDTLRRYPEVR